MKDNKGSHEVSMHGSTLTTLNVLITLGTLICVTNFLLHFQKLQFVMFFQCIHQFLSQTYMNSLIVFTTCSILGIWLHFF